MCETDIYDFTINNLKQVQLYRFFFFNSIAYLLACSLKTDQSIAKTKVNRVKLEM